MQALVNSQIDLDDDQKDKNERVEDINFPKEYIYQERFENKQDQNIV